MTELPPFSLAGQTIMVTGANTGIGQGIARAAAFAGAHILGVGRSTMDETAALIGDAFTPIRADFLDSAASAEMLARAWADHPIDGLVNNAGILRRADATDLGEDDWDAVIDTNLKTVFFLCQAFGKLVLAAGRKGKIVNVASLLSYQGGIRVASYAASKHGVSGITQALCNEWAGRGINVNAIAPGYIETNNTIALRADPERSAAILGRIPAGRWGRPSDIGDTAVFLLSAASNYVNGAVIPVDGGWLAR